MSLSLLEQAVAMHQQGQFGGAARLYQTLLAAEPDNALALHHLAFVRHALGEQEEALASLQQALVLQPQRADWWCDLGKLHGARLELQQAARAFQKSLALDDQGVDAWNLLGVVLEDAKQPEEAQLCFETAVSIDPEHIDALNNLGNLLLNQDKAEQAAPYVCRAFVLQPAEQQEPSERAAAFYTLGQIDDAAEVYRQWLASEPDNGYARHMLAACGGAPIPARAEDGYLQDRFDRFADSFDQHLGGLGYSGPALIAEALELSAPATPFRRALDAGCGTGLCRDGLRPHVDHLIGLDLSANMLAHCRSKGGYDELVQSELLAFLQQSPPSFDLIAAADTLIYFGDLHPLLQAAANASLPQAVLVITIETYPGIQPVHLHPSGRYQHTLAHVQAALSTAGYTLLRCESATIRSELGKPVMGAVLTARKQA